MKAGERAHGIKNVTRSDRFFYGLPTGELVLSPAVVTEALAQLGSWLKMFSSDFMKQPVLLADEYTYYENIVLPGDQLDLYVEVLDINDDVVATRSYAEVNSKRVLTTTCCRGYLLPISEFDDRNQVLRRFNALYKPELLDLRTPLPRRLESSEVPAKGFARSCDFVDGLLEHKAYSSITAYRNFASSEDYFASHFPYKPIVPGVLLMTFIGEACQFLAQENLVSHDYTRFLVPTYVRNARFRKFVEPGDQVIVKAEVVSGDMSKDAQDIVMQATLMSNNKRVMQSEMGFRTMYGEASKALESMPTIER
jgi:3-hydroxymyristoyl/3-hydroxydecanoyl-(acyl carrier protein) dehydratase